jgi:hypothetical protein
MLKHEPLEDASLEIRLLVIGPADSVDAPLKGYLLHAKLDYGEYNALSYVWGD